MAYGKQKRNLLETQKKVAITMTTSLYIEKIKEGITQRQ